MARRCAKLPEAARSCPRLPEAAKSCRKLPFLSPFSQFQSQMTWYGGMDACYGRAGARGGKRGCPGRPRLTDKTTDKMTGEAVVKGDMRKPVYLFRWDTPAPKHNCKPIKLIFITKTVREKSRICGRNRCGQRNCRFSDLPTTGRRFREAASPHPTPYPSTRIRAPP